EARLFGGVGGEADVGEVRAQLADAVVELSDEALARAVEQVALSVGGVDNFDAAGVGLVLHERLKRPVGLRLGDAHGVPGLRLDLQVDLPVWIRLQLRDEEAGVTGRVVAVHPAVEAVGEVGGHRLGGGGRRTDAGKGGEKKRGSSHGGSVCGYPEAVS